MKKRKQPPKNTPELKKLEWSIEELANMNNNENRNKDIGRLLAYLRLDKGLTQQQLSDALGIAQTTYAGYETGRHEPNIETLIKLADIYTISLDYLTMRYSNKIVPAPNMDYEEIIDNVEKSPNKKWTRKLKNDAIPD